MRMLSIFAFSMAEGARKCPLPRAPINSAQYSIVDCTHPQSGSLTGLIALNDWNWHGKLSIFLAMCSGRPIPCVLRSSHTYIPCLWNKVRNTQITSPVMEYNTSPVNVFYRAMLAQSAVMRLHVVRLSVCLSVCNVQVPWPHTLEFFENNFTAE